MDRLSDIQNVVAVLGELIRDSSIRTAPASDVDERFYARLAEANQEYEEVSRETPTWGAASLSIANFAANRVINESGNVPTSLKVCSPLLDELLNGWLGRMMILNCTDSQKAMLAQMLESARQVSPEIMPESDISKFAPIILQASREDFLRFLTFDAFNRALIAPSGNRPGKKSVKHLAAYERHAIFKLPSKYLRLCPGCVEDDLAKYSYSYWRRSHQISGCLWCDIHDEPLRIAQDKDATVFCPHQVDSFADVRLLQLTTDQVEMLKRYRRIANAVLQDAPQILEAAASEIFGRRSRMLELRSGRVGKKKTVSQFVQEILPAWWLSETFSRIKWAPNKHIPGIDGACTTQTAKLCTTNTFCMLAAVFYENAEEALAALMNPQRKPRDREKGAAYWSRKEVWDLYVSERGNVTRVAERLNMYATTVSVGLRNQGLPALGHSSSVKTCLERFLSGESIAETCYSEEDIAALEAVIRAACTPLKAATDAMKRQKRNDGDDEARYARVG
ncbi:TniQ family protein [Herbaspirillum camelliae]|uniref:TniQ family protein n=1 Tax=Herbaspirillum camelliae TaxID=1892903 RepID=UPI00094A0AF1|nr:TniQ family protein [Herbaspirillum camelliae]